MSCQRKTRFRIAAAALCLGMLSGPVLAAETRAGADYQFTGLDFSGEEASLTGVCITGLPQESNGVFRLGNRVIRTGDILTAQQLEQLVFAPADTEDDAAVSVQYLPVYADRIDQESTMVIAIRGSRDDAPVAEDSSIETYKNLPNEGLLQVTEPEGEAMTYTLVRSPKRGEVVIREDGSFLYTPKKNKVGTDSFTFTAADPAGNISREATVTIRILKPSDSTQYTDTVDSDCRFEAEWMKNTGIFAGETVSGQSCFSPDKTVTRGQFLAMLMQTLELPVDRSAVYTGFLDDAQPWQRPYLAAALRSGIISGYPVEGGVEFRPEQPITAAEAAAMMQNAFSFAVPTAAMDTGCESLLTLPPADAVMTRSDAAIALYELSQLETQLRFGI